MVLAFPAPPQERTKPLPVVTRVRLGYGRARAGRPVRSGGLHRCAEPKKLAVILAFRHNRREYGTLSSCCPGFI